MSHDAAAVNVRSRGEVASEPGNAFGLTRVSGGLGELSPPLSAMMTIARLGEGCREAGRPCIRCLSPASTCRGVFGRSLRAAANCAELCGTGKCDYCCGSATRLRVGDCAAVHSDGGPGAGCSEVCCDEVACRGFVAGSHITHVQNCTNLHCFQTNDRLTPLFGHPARVDHCATWLEPTALLLLERIPDDNGSYCAIPIYPPSYLI